MVHIYTCIRWGLEKLNNWPRVILWLMSNDLNWGLFDSRPPLLLLYFPKRMRKKEEEGVKGRTRLKRKKEREEKRGVQYEWENNGIAHTVASDSFHVLEPHQGISPHRLTLLFRAPRFMIGRTPVSLYDMLLKFSL